MRPSEVTICDDGCAVISNLKNRMAIVDAFLGPLKGKRSLDVGCRTGVMSEHFMLEKNLDSLRSGQRCTCSPSG